MLAGKIQKIMQYDNIGGAEVHFNFSGQNNVKEVDCCGSLEVFEYVNSIRIFYSCSFK